MTIGVGLVGYGLAGRWFHAPLAAASGLAVRAVVTSRADVARAQLPRADVVAFDALLARRDVDLVIVATPNALHFEQARAALQAGKHVVIDKPVTPAAAEARTLAGIARDGGLVAAAFHNRRWDSDFLTLKSLIARGALGAPARYRTSWNRHRLVARTAWRDAPGPGAGLLYDLGSHLIDQALALFGRPDWIAADVFRQRPPDGAPDDGFELLLGFGRVRAHLAACSLAAGPSRTIRLDGEDGSFVKTGLDPQEERLRAGHDPSADGFGAEPEDRFGVLWNPDGTKAVVRSEAGRWTAFYDGVRRAIEDGAPPPVSLDEAADTIAVIEAAFESSRTGRRVGL